MDKKKLLLATLLASTLVGSAAYADRSGGINLTSPIGGTFENGSANYGGALQQTIASVVSANTIFNNNTAIHGGAIYNGKSLTINQGSQFYNNEATSYGGAIVTWGAGLTLDIVGTEANKVVFSGNSSGTHGGAIANIAATTNVDYATFTANQSARGGAIGMTNDGSAVTVNNSTFQGNTASSTAGAIYLAKGVLKVNDSIFNGNTANEGGAIESATGNNYIEITESSFENNVAGNTGVLGIYGYGGTNKITTSSFTSNHSNRTSSVDGTSIGAGAIALGAETKTIIEGTADNYVTFTNNTAAIEGGAIDTRHIEGGTNTSATLDINYAKFTGNKSGVIYNTETGEITASSYDASHKKGGAINNNFYNSSTKEGYVYIGNSEFDSNSAVSGGAIYNNANSTQVGKIWLEDSTFTGNTAATSGGAIYNKGTITFSGTNTFSSNKVGENIDDIDGDGGTINIAGGTTIVSTIKNQTVGVNAGELHLTTTATDGSNIAGSTVSVASGAVMNTIDGVINDYSSLITLADGAKVKLDTSLSGTPSADKYIIATGGSVTVNEIKVLTDTANASETVNIADAGNVSIAEGVSAFTTDNKYTILGNTANSGEITLTKAAGGGVKGAADSTEVTPATRDNVTYSLTGVDSTTTAGEAKITNADMTIIGAGDSNTQKIVLSNDLTVGTSETDTSTLTLNEVKFEEGDTAGKIVNNEAATLIIKDSVIGVTIQNKGTLISDPTVYKAGIINQSGGNVTVNDDIFQDNDRGANGGAVVNEVGGIFTANNATFINNKATGKNGGAIINQGTATINGGAFGTVDLTDPANPVYSNGNTARLGGAIHSNAATLTIDGTEFYGNSAAENGGAVFTGTSQSNNTSILGNTIFAGNTAKKGGAIYQSGSNANLQIGGDGNKVIFNNNSTTVEGGAIDSLGKLTIEGAEFTTNKSVYGGAINYGATSTGARTLSIADTLFDSNKANNGGALYYTSSIASTLTDVDMENNTATASGGAIYQTLGTLNITGGSYDSNSAKEGGAISTKGNLNITNVEFNNNEANTTYGGAISAYNSTTSKTINITDSTFTKNSASASTNSAIGGAIFTSSFGNVTIKGSTFGSTTDSTLGNSAQFGGAIAVANGSKIITNKNDSDIRTVFGYNTANEGGAIYASQGGLLDIAYTDFEHNSATATDGGAISIVPPETLSTTPLSIDNSTFTSNTAVRGGGAVWAGDNINITNSTFTSNETTGTGDTDDYGAGALFVGGSSNTNVINSKFASNTSVGNGGAIATRDSSTTSSLNITGDGTAATEFNGNSAANGGAIYTGVQTVIANTNFTNNTATTAGGAIYNNTDNTLAIIADGTDVTFSGNTANSVANDIYNTGRLDLIATGSNSITFNGGITGTGDININSLDNVSSYKVLSGSNIVDQDISTASGAVIFNADVNANDLSVASGTLQVGTAKTLAVGGDMDVSNATFTNNGTLRLTGGSITGEGDEEEFNFATITGDFTSGTTRIEGIVDGTNATIGALEVIADKGIVTKTANLTGSIANDGTVMLENTEDGTIGAAITGTAGDDSGEIIIASEGKTITANHSIQNQEIKVESGSTFAVDTTAGTVDVLGTNTTVKVESGAIISTIDNAINDYQTGDIVTLKNGASVKVDVSASAIDKFTSQAGTISLIDAAFTGTGDIDVDAYQIASAGTVVDTGENGLFVQTGSKTIAIKGSGSNDGKVKVHSSSSTGLNGAIDVSDTGNITYTVNSASGETVNVTDAELGHIQDKFILKSDSATTPAEVKGSSKLGIIVDNGKQLDVNNIKFSGFTTGTGSDGDNYEGTITVKSDAKLVIKDSIFEANSGTGNVGIRNYGILESDPTTYHSRVVTSGTASFDGDLFENITGGINGGAIENSGTLTIQKEVVDEGGIETTYKPTFTNNTSSGRGGAIYTSNTTTISDAIFGSTTDSTLGNTADEGGAIFIDTGDKNITVTINDTVFANNSATTYGGAIDHRMGTVNISGSTFSNNSAGEQGGAILERLQTANAFMNISDSTFTSNTAKSDGGAIDAFANLTLENTNFTSNSVTGTSADGGGALFLGSEAVASVTGNGTDKGIFSNNTSSTRGGAIATRDIAQGNNEKGKLDITNVQFSGNQAATDGGAIYNAFYNDAAGDGYVKVTGSTFTNNSAARGGAVFNDGADRGGHVGVISFTDTNFTNNTASDKGGAIYSAGNVTINAVNSAVTFSGNTAAAGNDIYMLGTTDSPVTLALNAKDNTNTITFGGGIDGQNYNINVNSATGNTGNVIFNGDVNAGALSVAAGTLTNNAGLTVKSGANSGTIAMTGSDGTFTLNDGGATTPLVFDNNGSFTQKSLTITSGEFQTNANNLHLTDNIANAGTLTLEGGTLANNVTGDGTTKITGEVNFTNTTTAIAQAVNIATTGKLTAATTNLTGTSDIKNDGTLTFSGAGTIAQSIVKNTEGSGTVEIAAGAGNTINITSGKTISDNTIKLTSGTFDAKNLADTNGNVTFSGVTANGGTLSVQDGKTGTITLGDVDTATYAKDLNVAIDVDLVGDGTKGAADHLTQTGTLTGSNKINFSNIALKSDAGSVTPDNILIADSTIDTNSISLGQTTISGTDIGNLLLTLSNDTNGTYLHTEHSDLANAITSTIATKAYSMTAGSTEQIGALTLGGNSLSITGNGSNITSTATDKSLNGITLVAATQELSIANATIGSATNGFATAIDNAIGGTVNLTNVTMTGNTTDIINNGEIDLTDPSNPVNHGVFLTGTNSINTIKDSTGDASKGQTTISSGTSTIGSLIQKSVTVESPATLDIAADKLVTTDGTDNQGTLNLDEGNLASNITDSHAADADKTGVTNIVGDVKNTNGKTINQKSVTVASNASLTTAADKVTAVDGIDNAGTLNVSGSTGTDAPTALASVVKNATGTTNITGNVSTDKNITQNNFNVGTLDTSTDPATETTGNLVNNAVVNATNIKTTANSSITSNASDLVASAGIDNAGTLNLTGDIDDTVTPAVETGKLASNISNTNGTTNVLGNISTNGKTINQATVNVGNDTITATLDNLTNPSTITTSGDINIASTGTVSSAANNLIANGANGIANNGILNLNGGALASKITGSNGVTSIAGDVTSDKDITQDTIFVGSSGADTSGYYPSPVTADGSFTNTGNIDADYVFVTENGELNQNGGTIGTDNNPTSIVNEGTTNINAGDVIADAITTWSEGETNITGGSVVADVIGSGDDSTTNITGGDVTAGGIVTVGDATTNLDGGSITATNGIHNAGNATTNINTAVVTPEVNAYDGIVNLNSGSDTSSSTKLGSADINIEDGIVNINTTADNYSVDNSVNGVNNGDGSLDLNGKSGVPRTASTANETIFTIDAAVNNANVTLASGQLNLPNENNITNSTLNVANGATLNTMDGSGKTYNSNINFADGAQVKTDVDVFSQTADKFANATEAGNEVLTDVNLANLDKIVRNNTNINLKNATGLSGLVVSDELQGRKFQAMTPIRIMEATIGADGMMNIHPSSGRNDWKSFNPSILASPVAAQLGGYLTQLNSYDEAFRNMDMYMLMTRSQRQALKLRNKYAAATTDFVTFDPNQTPYEKSAGWFRPYANFEKVNLKHGPKVSNVAYGSFFGGESEMKDLGHGWDGMWGAYVGYNGSHQAYNGISIYQNGGTLGAVGMAYKGDFFTGLTVNVGANAAEASTWYGNDNFSMLMAGIASKTGYNWELAHSKFIIQPSFLASYSFVNTFDYTNAAGVRINSDPLHAIQVEPGIKFIGNFENGWQPYVGVSMVWNIMDKTDFNANDIALPELSVKPFVKYGIGVRKTWGERFTGFFQTYFTNGGRNGVGLQAGLRWVVGKEGSSNKSSAKTTGSKKVVKEMTTRQKAAASGQKKVLRQMASK